MGDLIGLVAVVLIFGPALVIPLVAMTQKHRKEMLMLELEKRRQSNEEVLKQIEALRREIAELRETTTQYDMSLQANLENLQARVRALEESQNQVVRY
ncbi:MAG: hypothetical protein N2045_09130 [Fimbriimonadales bacterium]|jgi:predicted transcriptional regulator|nr:hypothetical protein [Armatimonadota bacterium]MCX7688119.1 hypothetical protein [Fimbriimonadales bacterium]CUU01471.1 hypothetical protein GBSOP10_101018 [Armatimonadetes bacterium GBS]CUU35462.1 hypothetical protein GXSOP10_12148 [Armatimonadetes bacterium GXS]CUU38322.1 hypothetical protein DCOP10_12537 [Armatimonadetes bacterium DC]GBC91163.1 hypothetical protein HRbin14_01922 [bacterium HR14]